MAQRKIQWSCAESSHSLLNDAMSAFEATAYARIGEVLCSPLDDDPFEEDQRLQSCNTASQHSGFAFALRSLAAAARYASDGVAAELMHWMRRAREWPGAATPSEEDRESRESAVNTVFCEAMLATLGAACCRDSIMLDSLQECALDFFRTFGGAASSATRQQAARRRLLALGGRTEEALWTELVRALCRNLGESSSARFRSFESFTHKVLLHLENTGSDRSGRSDWLGRSDWSPDFGTLAMCSSLQGVQLPRGSGLPAIGGAVGGASGSGAAEPTRVFLERIASRVLFNQAIKPLRRPVAEALGMALLDQALDEAARSGGVAPPPSERDARALAQLHALELQLAQWLIKKIKKPIKRNAKFESWSAPLATALLCAVRSAGSAVVPAWGAEGGVGFLGPDTSGGGGGGGLGEGLSEKAVELHVQLLGKIKECLKHSEHRVIALRCMRLQLPLLLSCRAATKEVKDLLDRLFATKDAVAMQLEMPRDRKDFTLVLRRYADCPLMTTEGRSPLVSNGL
jgi:hypothetical protein